MKITNQTKTRIFAINKLIELIGSLDRKFYSKSQDGYAHDGNEEFSYFWITNQETLWFYDSKQGTSFSANRKEELQKNNYNGHTLNYQLELFRYFIKDGKPINIYSKYWGYNEESLKEIHKFADELGILIKFPSNNLNENTEVKNNNQHI